MDAARYTYVAKLIVDILSDQDRCVKLKEGEDNHFNRYGKHEQYICNAIKIHKNWDISCDALCEVCPLYKDPTLYNMTIDRAIEWANGYLPKPIDPIITNEIKRKAKWSLYEADDMQES